MELLQATRLKLNPKLSQHAAKNKARMSIPNSRKPDAAHGDLTVRTIIKDWPSHRGWQERSRRV